MNLLELVNNSKYIVAFTGAGLSTESDIPDFRSSSGLYLSGEFEGYTPETILSHRFFRKNPLVFTSFYQKRIMTMRDKQPSRPHYLLKKLEEKGKLKCVINQNIDNLLQKVGVQKVLDLHGNITSFNCRSCGKSYTQDEYMSFTVLPKCECGGIVRPNTVLFDEPLDGQTYDSVYYIAKEADLMIVIGSSLSVFPACGLVKEISKDCKLVIINQGTTLYDKCAHLIIKESCGEVLEKSCKSIMNYEEYEKMFMGENKLKDGESLCYTCPKCGDSHYSKYCNTHVFSLRNKCFRCLPDRPIIGIEKVYIGVDFS